MARGTEGTLLLGAIVLIVVVAAVVGGLVLLAEVQEQIRSILP